MTVSTENYIKVITSFYINTNKEIRTSQLSDILNITPASVTEMIKKMAQKNLIKHEPYKGISLTSKGKKLGLSVLRRHRLLELFLTTCLDISWDDVHEEAERLEHAVSDMLIDKIDSYLKYPKFDPHGDPIPQKDGRYPSYDEVYLLSEIKIGFEGQIARISNDDKSFLTYISSIHCNIGTHLTVLKSYDFDNSMDILVQGKKVHISDYVTKNIWLVPINLKEK